MHNRIALGVVFLTGFMAGSLVLVVHSQEAKTKSPAKETAPPDAVAEAQTPREVPVAAPEQKKTAHDKGAGRPDGSRSDGRFRLLSGSPRRYEAGDDL